MLSNISCSHLGGQVPDVEACSEIPFLDGAEGACSTTVSKKKYIINKEDWKNKRPKMIMVEAKYWSQIKLEWKKACRVLGEKCNVTLDSIDKTINGLDNVLKKYFESDK